jgi:hypothetical protein
VTERHRLQYRSDPNLEICRLLYVRAVMDMIIMRSWLTAEMAGELDIDQIS